MIMLARGGSSIPRRRGCQTSGGCTGGGRGTNIRLCQIFKEKKEIETFGLEGGGAHAYLVKECLASFWCALKQIQIRIAFSKVSFPVQSQIWHDHVKFDNITKWSQTLYFVPFITQGILFAILTIHSIITFKPKKVQAISPQQPLSKYFPILNHRSCFTWLALSVLTSQPFT